MAALDRFHYMKVIEVDVLFESIYDVRFPKTFAKTVLNITNITT